LKTLPARGLRKLRDVERRGSVNGFCLPRWIFSTGYERHFTTHARGLLRCAGTNCYLALASTLELQHDFVNSEHSRRSIATPSGSDGSGEPIAVLFIRPGILKETITTGDRPVRQRYDRCAVAIRGPEPGGVFSICKHPTGKRSRSKSFLTECGRLAKVVNPLLIYRFDSERSQSGRTRDPRMQSERWGDAPALGGAGRPTYSSQRSKTRQWLREQVGAGFN